MNSGMPLQRNEDHIKRKYVPNYRPDDNDIVLSDGEDWAYLHARHKSGHMEYIVRTAPRADATSGAQGKRHGGMQAMNLHKSIRTDMEVPRAGQEEEKEKEEEKIDAVHVPVPSRTNRIDGFAQAASKMQALAKLKAMTAQELKSLYESPDVGRHSITRLANHLKVSRPTVTKACQMKGVHVLSHAEAVGHTFAKNIASFTRLRAMSALQLEALLASHGRNVNQLSKSVQVNRMTLKTILAARGVATPGHSEARTLYYQRKRAMQNLENVQNVQRSDEGV
jgi:hypothetical protein